MQEFSSISVSSYEAGTLAERLTEQSSEGWMVVAIVPTGSTVTAYLSRPASAAGAASPADTSGGEATETAWVAGSTAEADTTPAEPVSAASGFAESDAMVAEHAPTETVESAASPVAEAAGWAASSVADDTTADATADAATIAELADLAATDTATASEATTSAATTSAATTSEAAASAATTSAATTGEAAASEAAASATGAAPAGWYADPSARYELRYWDGGQWTEHVSRGGQQFTDPPVA